MNASARVAASAAHRGRLSGAVVAASVLMLVCAAPAWPDVPDNRGVSLNPEDPLSPAYEDTLDRRDEQRLEEALDRGDSFVKTVHGTGRVPGGGLPPALQYGPEGGAERSSAGESTRRGVSTRGGVDAGARPANVYESVGLPAARGTGGGEDLAALVAVLLEAWNRPPQIVSLRYAAPRDRGAAAGRSAERAAQDGPRPPYVAAGTGLYARTLYAVDSDYPGPVVLELLQPPLAGAVAHGGFERVRQRLVLRLASLTWRGRTFPLDAWAVDPSCACYGIEGEVDRHFVSRVLLPAAARFAEGFLTAVAAPARTLTMQDGTVFHERGAAGEREALHAGAGAAAQTLGDILMADAPKETTVRIPRDTPLVVMVARDLARAPGAAPDPGWRERANAGE